MIVCNGALHSLALDGEVRVAAVKAFSLESVFLGTSFRPSRAELRQIAPFRFSISDDGVGRTQFCQSVSRDFGDSVVHYASNAEAVAEIASGFQPRELLSIPAAMSFAFAQQWARLGHACVHGAMLNVHGKGVLVVGQRAAGKSVLSASALAVGGAIITDDYLLLGANNDDIVLGERIRRFISLRRSWASDALVKNFGEGWTPDRSGRRVFLRVEPDDERFPEFSRIDTVWVLVRPRAGRSNHSSLERISHAEVYAALVSSIQPLLLGTEFPHERNKLTDLFAKLITRVPVARIETGQDIVLDSTRTWERLLAYSS